jgi:hypothetical protein
MHSSFPSMRATCPADLIFMYCLLNSEPSAPKADECGARTGSCVVTEIFTSCFAVRTPPIHVCFFRKITWLSALAIAGIAGDYREAQCAWKVPERWTDWIVSSVP